MKKLLFIFSFIFFITLLPKANATRVIVEFYKTSYAKVGDTIQFVYSRSHGVLFGVTPIGVSQIINEDVYVLTAPGEYNFRCNNYTCGSHSMSGKIMVEDATATSYPLVESIGNVFPNPMENTMTVSLQHSEDNKINIYNNIGALISTHQISNSLEQSIDVSMLPSGYYVVELFDVIHIKRQVVKVIKK